MASSFTILCPSKDYATVAEAARANSSLHMTMVGEDLKWESISLQSSAHILKLTTLERPERGGKFWEIISGMHCHFRNGNTADVAMKEMVLDKITSTQLMIGVIVEPCYSEEEGDCDVIFGILKATNGVLFDGLVMVDADQNILMEGLSI